MEDCRWLTPTANPGHIPEVSKELGPFLQQRPWSQSLYWLFLLPNLTIHPRLTLPLLLPGTPSIKPLLPTPFSGSALGAVQTKMGHVAGDPEREVSWCAHRTTENARISEDLLRTKPWTCQGDTAFFERALPLPDFCSNWGDVSQQHVRDQEHFLSAFGACHVGCGQQIDVPNYIWLKLILSICLISQSYNAGSWWGRRQKTCWVAVDGNLGF